MRRLLAAAAALALLSACGSDDEGGDITADDLDGNSYESTEVTGHEMVEGTSITLNFEDDSMSAQAGCNTMSSAFEVDDTLLRWTGEPASTLMACSEELTAQDAWLTELFTEGVDAALEDDVLILTSGNETIKLSPAGS
jgi:heat shock protein HslJ